MWTKFKKIIVLLLILFFPNVTFASSAKTVDLHVSSLKNKVRLIYTVNSPIKYHIYLIQKPNRLITDLYNARLITNLDRHVLSQSVIKNIRSSKHKNGILRIVLDLKKPINYHNYLLSFKHSKRRKLVIDLWPKYYSTSAKSTKSVKSVASIVTLSRHEKLRDVIIVIDPGHGGRDPGATGRYGTHEKDVVLAISQDLQKLLNSQYGFKADLTRNSDYFVSLRRRLAIARGDHGDMFIAIHADGYKNRYAHGASVFALSQRGATSEAARWLAQKENESELGHVLANKSNTLRSVLIDLAQTASISTSLMIGNSIAHQLVRVTNLHHGFVEQAAFVVLKEPDIPSLLVETGFISNAQEELNLRNPVYQHEIANALMLGIVDYFKHRPPLNTFLAARRDRKSSYAVQRGDTLIKIAEQNDISIKQLKLLNHLSNNNTIKIGQMLKLM
jgi:N-acetylmuramoyl-L-alanine amidase